MEYALPFGMVVIVVAVASIAFNDILVSLFTGTINSDNSGGPIKAEKLATLSNPFAILNGFDKAKLDALMAKMTVQCVGGVNACIPVYGGTMETSGGMGQEEVDRMTQYLLSALRAASTDTGIDPALQAKFRALADLGLELSNTQLKLSKAIADGDLAAATTYINAINGGSKTFILASCMGGVNVTCIGTAPVYNIVTTPSSGSIMDYITSLETTIKADPQFLAIPGAADAMTSVFDALNTRTNSISILASGAPPLTAAYTTTEITTFVNEVTGTTVYLNSLISTIGMSTLSDSTTSSYISAVDGDGGFSGDKKKHIKSAVNQLVSELSATMLADPAYQAKLSGGTYDLRTIATSAETALLADPANPVLIANRDAAVAELASFNTKMQTAFSAELGTMSGKPFNIASKLQSELLADTTLGQDLIDAAITLALSENSYNELLVAIKGGTTSGSAELVDAVMGALSEDSSMTTDLQTKIVSATLTTTDTDAAATSIITDITTIENTKDAVEALKKMAKKSGDGADLSCDTGKGKFFKDNCLP